MTVNTTNNLPEKSLTSSDKHRDLLDANSSVFISIPKKRPTLKRQDEEQKSPPKLKAIFEDSLGIEGRLKESRDNQKLRAKKIIENLTKQSKTPARKPYLPTFLKPEHTLPEFRREPVDLTEYAIPEE
jgi:hypothetical protein